MISIDYDKETRETLLDLVNHREEILDQIEGNFGDIRQRPCFGNPTNKAFGFEVLLPDFYINEDGDHTILLKFEKRKYSMQLKVSVNNRIPYYLWLYWERNITLSKSRKFIETVYKFLNNFNRIQPSEEGTVVKSEDIRKNWDKLINEIPHSI